MLQWVCDHIIVTAERVSLSWRLRYIFHNIYIYIGFPKYCDSFALVAGTGGKDQ